MTSINNTNTNDGSPGINFDSVASVFPQGPTDAGRRLTEALAARFPKTADEALPAIEYRVGSLRALRPCTNLGEAIELARRDDAALHESDDAEIVTPGDAAPGPDEVSREAIAAKVRTRAPKALYLNGEPVLTTPRFWWSLFVRCGLS
jgi:hypothetical protein